MFSFDFRQIPSIPEAWGGGDRPAWAFLGVRFVREGADLGLDEGVSSRKVEI
jgi:hypothetical protein